MGIKQNNTKERSVEDIDKDIKRTRVITSIAILLITLITLCIIFFVS